MLPPSEREWLLPKETVEAVLLPSPELGELLPNPELGELLPSPELGELLPNPELGEILPNAKPEVPPALFPNVDLEGEAKGELLAVASLLPKAGLLEGEGEGESEGEAEGKRLVVPNGELGGLPLPAAERKSLLPPPKLKAAVLLVPKEELGDLEGEVKEELFAVPPNKLGESFFEVIPPDKKMFPPWPPSFFICTVSLFLLLNIFISSSYLFESLSAIVEYFDRSSVVSFFQPSASCIDKLPNERFGCASLKAARFSST